MVGCYKGL